MEVFNMSTQCSVVIFSNKAYNAIIQETFDKHPVETGGILLGHVVDDAWVVMEVLPPGINSVFEYAYFEYDHQFVNYLADKIASKYKYPLSLLGLWHRHPGSMDVFSQTDDGTNRKFAKLSDRGAISGLVNVDPNFRITMYHLGKEEKPTSPFERPNYSVVDIEVGDDIIPEHFFELKFCNHDNINLHPRPTGYKSEPLREERYDQYNHVAPTNDTIGNITPSSSPTTKQLISELVFRSSNWCSQNWKYVLSVLIFIVFFLFMVTSKQLQHSKERGNIVLKEKTERTIKKEPKGSEPSQDIKEDDIKDNVIKQESESELNI